MNNSRSGDGKLLMLLLALYPITYYYNIIAGIGLGQILFLFAAVVLVLRDGFSKLLFYPKHFLLFWAVAAISLIITSGGFKISYLIPGGVQFFVWAVIVGICSSHFNKDAFAKALKLVFIIAGTVFIFQFISVLVRGHSFCAVLPLSEDLNYGGLTFSQIVSKHNNAERPSSIFLEPSYFGQYGACTLLFELFDEKNKGKFLTPFSLFIIAIIVLSKSGCGYLGVFFLVAVKFFIHSKNLSPVSKITFVIFIIGGSVIVLSQFFKMEFGASMIERASEFGDEDSSASLRIVRGYIVYDLLPLKNKIIGISGDALKQLSLPFIIESEDGSLYFNGLQTVMIKMGLIGLLSIISVYWRSLKGASLASKVSVFLLLLISLIEMTYLMPFMVVLSAMPFNDQKRVVADSKNSEDETEMK